MFGRVTRGVRVALTKPDAASPHVVTAIALIPSIAAGLILFRLPALEMLGIAAAAAVLGHLASHLLGLPHRNSPAVPAVVGVALVGSGASLGWVAAVAGTAAALELARARFFPAARLQVGLVAYALLLLASQGAVAVYVAPGSSAPVPEPIRLWHQYVDLGQAPIDPVRLYVGNVAGPVFATSVLAAAVGAAWLWYARRLSVLVILTFVAGAMLPIWLMDWSAAYHLDSGPLWFMLALVLADRWSLPASTIGRPLLGFTAGLVAMALRVRGLAIESTLLTGAGMQMLVVGVAGVGWLAGNPQEVRARLRDVREAALHVRRPRHVASRRRRGSRGSEPRTDPAGDPPR